MAIVIRGLTQTRAALRKLEPDLLKASDKQMRRVLKVIVNDARSFVPGDAPLSGWNGSGSFPGFNASSMKSGITSHIGNSKANLAGYSSIYSIRDMSAAGAIYELAGEKNPRGAPWAGPSASKTNHDVSHSRNPRAGAQFIDAIQKQSNQRMPRSPRDARFIGTAIKKDNGKASMAIELSLDEAVAKFYSRVSARAAFE